VIDASFLFDLAIGACAVALGPLLGARAAARRSRLAMAAAAVHPIVSVGLFYSLAIHMHRRLGGWPRGIGDRGFPDGLALHADLASHAFGALLLGCLFSWPLAVLLCASAPRLRPGLLYLGIYGLTGGAAFGAMMLAPEPFLYWWWD
jgi:hypothetical protein